MMIQSTFEVGTGAGSSSQTQAIGDEHTLSGLPSFIDVLSKSLRPDTEVGSKKVAKVAAATRHQEKLTADDKVDSAALLLGMNLPMALPERKSVHFVASAATGLKDDQRALTRGGPLLTTTAFGREQVAFNSGAHVVAGLVGSLAELLPAATQANTKYNLTGVGKAPSALATKELPVVEPFTEALTKMVPVIGDAENTLPVMPAAVNTLTAAVQTLTESLRRTPLESGRVGVPAGKDVPVKLPADPSPTQSQTSVAKNRFLNVATRGSHPFDSGAAVHAGLNPQAGQLSRSAENEVLLHAASAKAEGQFMTRFETLAADISNAVLPTAVGSMVHVGMELAGTSSAEPAILRTLLTPEVGNQDWDNALSQQMVQMGKAGHQVTELELNPPGLGPLKVTLDLNDHQMQLSFVSNHASVRAAVEAAVPQLRATLADNGISLGHTSVSAESQPQTQNAFSQGQGRAPDHRAYPKRSLPDSAAPMAQEVTATRRQSADLTVDTYA